MDITLDLVAGKLLLFYVYAIIVPYNGLFSKESFVQYTIKECSSKGTDKLRVFAASSDWFLVLFSSVVIGQGVILVLVLLCSIENRSMLIQVFTI